MILRLLNKLRRGETTPPTIVFMIESNFTDETGRSHVCELSIFADGEMVGFITEASQQEQQQLEARYIVYEQSTYAAQSRKQLANVASLAQAMCYAQWWFSHTDW